MSVTPRPPARQVIPDGWSVTSVGSLATFSSGTGISVASLRNRSSRFPIPVYGGNGIAGYTDKALLDGATVVIGRVGQRCGEVHTTEGPAWVTDNALYPVRYLRPLDVGFLGLALRGAGLNDVKNRNDLPLLTQGILHAVRLPWPDDLAEQRAIAGVLGDVDALLGALDRLIAKKRDLKQAAMQQLLTGQTRLPGFTGKWDTSTVGREFEIQLGKMVDAEGNTGVWKPYLGNKDVQWGRVDVSTLRTVRMTNADLQRYRLNKGDLLVCEGGARSVAVRFGMRPSRNATTTGAAWMNAPRPGPSGSTTR